jgi:hemoglobin
MIGSWMPVHFDAVGQVTVYEAVGGMPFFDALVERFYDGVEHDRVLRPLYPQDLGPSRRHLALFLAQYWGGPETYAEERGHPRLRMRHARFPIGPEERDRWLHHMREALTAIDTPSDVADTLVGYFEMSAEAMRSRDGGGAG